MVITMNVMKFESLDTKEIVLVEFNHERLIVSSKLSDKIIRKKYTVNDFKTYHEWLNFLDDKIGVFIEDYNLL